MFSIIPISYEFETALSPKKVAKKLNHDLVEQRPSMNIMKNGRFMRDHKFESCYYGCRTDQFEFQVFHHQAKKRDGGTTGFFGVIEPTENGSIIKGKFRKPIYTYVFAVIWTLVTLFMELMLYALKENAGALCSLGIFAVGIFIMFWDNKKSLVKAYLDQLKMDS